MEYIEEYNNWLERLYGNYVLLLELFIKIKYEMNIEIFKYETLHLILLNLMNKNSDWTWNIIYIVLIFHGLMLQKLYAKRFEKYLECIDELLDNDNKNNKIKYKHISKRIATS
eukprot:384137_1